MILAILAVAAGIWGLWRWAPRLARRDPRRRRLITGVLLGVTVGAGIPLLIAAAATIFAILAARKVDGSNKATFLAEGISRGLSALAWAVVITAAGAIVFLVVELTTRGRRTRGTPSG
jgi:hypothetical protein